MLVCSKSCLHARFADFLGGKSKRSKRADRDMNKWSDSKVMQQAEDLLNNCDVIGVLDAKVLDQLSSNRLIKFLNLLKL